MLVVGPVDLHIGAVSVGSRGFGRPLILGTFAGSVGLALLEPLLTVAAQARLRRACSATACAAAVVSIVTLVRPLLLPGFPDGHDSGAHLTYTFLMDRALGQGQLPVRWVEGTVPGLGQPLFNHYQVGFFYLVALIHRAGAGLGLAFKLTVVGAWAAGGAFVFMLCRRLGTFPALLAAMVFVWSPYLLVDVYVRAAYPELTAIACTAGLIWALDAVLRTGRPWYVCMLALITALLLLSHLPTAMIVAPVAVASLLSGCWLHAAQRERMWMVAGGAVLGAGLAAFYVIPAIAELSYVGIGKLTTAYFDYHRHFVRPQWWVDWSWGYGGSGEDPRSQLSLQIGLVQWLVLLAALAWLGVALIQRRPLTQVAAVAGWVLVALGAMFMMTSASVLIWEHASPLAFIQFPWRYLMLPALACGVLSARLLTLVRSRTVQALILICAVTLLWYGTRDPRRLASTRERLAMAIDNPAWPTTDAERQRVFREPGYDPASVTEQPRHAAAERWSLAEGRAAVSVLSDTDARREYRIVAEGDARLIINSPFYPGWHVFVDGRPVPVSVVAGSGYMEIQVPPGTHHVDARFGRTAIRTAAESVTLASAASWVGLAAWAGWRRRLRERR